MEIKTVGTGAISAKSRSACTLIDSRILVDCGNGIVKTLLEQNIDISKIDTLLITHLHGDHFLDIPLLIMHRSFESITNPLNIYCPFGTEQTVDSIFRLIYPDLKDWTVLRDKTNVKFIEFDNLDNVEVTDNYFVSSYDVVHGNFKPAFGYVITCKGKSVGLSGDSGYCENIEKINENSDISVLDMSFLDSLRTHLGVHDIEILSSKFNKKIIPTHMSEPAREYIIERNLENVVVMNDGDTLEF